MNEIMAIAEGTWRRILRMKSVYFLVVCVLVLIASAYNYDVLSMQEHKPLMIDVSLVLNTIAVVLVVISMTFEIPRELREGVASTLLTKPLGRTQYLIGKQVGTIVTGIVISFMIAIGFFVIFNLAFNEKIAFAMLHAHVLTAASIIPMSAVAVLFSVVLPEMLTPIATAIVIWFSYVVGSLKAVPIIYGGLLPDLGLFNFKAFANYGGDQASWGFVGLAVLWSIIFSIAMISLASLVFRFKDIK